MPGSTADVVVASAADVDAVLAPLVRRRRLIGVAGLPGVGKSLLVRAFARAAHDAGRAVHLLQWDVARLAFESPAILARYPEHQGITHAVIRKAVGEWARGAVLLWHRTHAADHILIGEVPLIGHRLLPLVQPRQDESEALLAGDGSLFVTPVPSVEVKAAIARARERTSANPAHPREQADAPPPVMESAWQEVHALAVVLGAGRPAPEGPAPFDPAAYAAVYRHLLRHRHALTLQVNARLEPQTSVYDLGVEAHQLIPTTEEAAMTLARLEREQSVPAIEADVAGWFHRV